MTERIFKAMVVLQAVDRMTAVVDKAFKTAEKRMEATERMANRTMAVSRGMATAAALVAAPLVLSANEAMKFEDAMASVGKVLNMQNGSKELEAVGKRVRQTAIYLAQTQEDAAGLYASLAQGGVAKERLDQVARIAGQMGVAFDMTAETAGDSFMKIQNALGSTIEKTKSLTDTINYLSDREAARASQIVDFFRAGGASATNMLRIAPEVSAAFGTMFISAGKSGEEAATIFERFTKGVMKGGNDASKIFQKAGGGLPGLMKVLEKGRTLSGEKQFKFFKAFGEYGPEVAQMANNYSTFQRILGEAQDKTAQYSSVQKEFENRMGTSMTKYTQAKIRLRDLAITVGTMLLPSITKLINAASNITSRVAKWMEANPKLTRQIVMGAAVFSVAAAALAGLTFIVGAAIKVYRIWRIAQIALNIVMAANPISLVILAIGALIAIVAYCWFKFEGFRRVVGGLASTFMEYYSILWDYVIKPLVAMQVQVWKLYYLIIGRFIKGVRMMPEMLKNSFPRLWAFFQATGIVIKKWLLDPIMAVWNLIQRIPAVKEISSRLMNASKRGSDWGASSTGGGGGMLGGFLSGYGGGGAQGNQLDFGSLGLGKSASLNYSPSIVMNGGATDKDRQNMEAILKQHKDQMASMVMDVMQRRERQKFQ